MFTFSVPSVISGLVLLGIRVVLAIVFYGESTYKFKHPKEFSKSDGVPLPLVYVVAGAEAAALLGMLSGVLAQWAGIGVMLLMLVTLSFHLFKWHSKYSAYERGYEYDVMVFFLAAAIAVFGAGMFALPF